VRAELAALELRRLSWRRVRAGVGAIADEFGEHDLLTYSSAIAFQVLYAVVPLCFVALAGLGVLGERSVYTTHVAPTLAHRLSGAAYTLVNSTALRVLDGGSRGFWLTVGLAITLWGVGSAIRSTMTPLNAIYGVRETRSWARRLLLSLGVAAIVVVCVFAALALAFGGQLVDPSGWALQTGLLLLRVALTLGLLLVAIAAVLRFVPAKSRPVTWVSIGSGLAAVCWMVATVGYGAYISSVSYTSVYGGLASVVLLLIYLHVAAIALLLGVVADSQLRKLVQRRARSKR
jgi:membrane protein